MASRSRKVKCGCGKCSGLVTNPFADWESDDPNGEFRSEEDDY